MAVTGLLIIGFLIAHLTGNLLIFAGPEKLNAYGQGLRDLGPLLWVARIGLIVMLGLHVWSSIELASRNRQARPVQYMQKRPLRSKLTSRTMLLSGLTILFFVTYHLLHYTLGIVQPATFYADSYKLADGRIVHDVYSMVIAGFKNPFITLSYIFAMVFVSAHLNHAVQSAFQTLGVSNTKYSSVISKIGPALAAILLIGYLSIPLSVLSGVIKPHETHQSAAQIQH
jgi:succinate dehydrogenase / fumarate reductase cytochrome b subunit